MHWVYILKSAKDGHIYIGSTSDLKERLKNHNQGRVRSTKSRRPFELLYNEQFGSVTEARKRENFLKSGQGRKWLREEILDRRSGRAVECGGLAR
jgi:putative endonuclease